MSSEIIDACCLINLFASGKAESILESSPSAHFITKQVEAESLVIRQPDDDDPGSLVSVPIDLTPVTEAELVKRCDFADETESRYFIEYAARIDDGEASCLAIAKARGWTIATDDRKAIRLATESSVDVITTPVLVRQWASIAGPGAFDIAAVIENIERFARFRIASTNPHSEWWEKQKSPD